MVESKSRLLYILKYLWQNTDAKHYATTADILAFLKGNGTSCDRKMIPSDIQILAPESVKEQYRQMITKADEDMQQKENKERKI